MYHNLTAAAVGDFRLGFHMEFSSVGTDRRLSFGNFGGGVEVAKQLLGEVVTELIRQNTIAIGQREARRGILTNPGDTNTYSYYTEFLQDPTLKVNPPFRTREALVYPSGCLS